MGHWQLTAPHSLASIQIRRKYDFASCAQRSNRPLAKHGIRKAEIFGFSQNEIQAEPSYL
jgi:hypothetical protein